MCFILLSKRDLHNIFNNHKYLYKTFQENKKYLKRKLKILFLIYKLESISHRKTECLIK